MRSREALDVASVAREMLLPRREEAARRGVDVYEAFSTAPPAGDRRLIERLA